MHESVKTARSGPIFEVVLGRPKANAIDGATSRAMGEGTSVTDCYRTMRDRGFPAFERLLASEDIKEGPRAFAEKRDPVWQWR